MIARFSHKLPLIDKLMTEAGKDICNSNNYDMNSTNLVSLVLFFDGASYAKSNNYPLRAFFSKICELPPLLRNCTRNIITHSLWTGSSPDLNTFLSCEIQLFQLNYDS